MPRIYDNATATLLKALQTALNDSRTYSLRIATGYFQLLAWYELIKDTLRFTNSTNFSCELLIGMLHRTEEVEELLSSISPNGLDWSKLDKEEPKEKVLAMLRRQLTEGLPTRAAEQALKKLHEHLQKRILTVKAYLCPQALHAKLYLIDKKEELTPQIAFLGSSNFTLAGLKSQGELNVDITDQVATRQLEDWFNSYWNRPCAVDITQDLAEAIEKSWAFQKDIHPYHLYLRIAYHLCEPALTLQNVKIPSIFEQKNTKILPHQWDAIVQLLYLLKNRKGALLGDVVGLGKTLTAAVIARIFFEERGGKTLVLCPPNLTSMWEEQLATYDIWGDVISIAEAPSKLKDYPPVSLVIIDESHNLRNPEGKRYEAIWKYLRAHTPMPKVLLLSATPYNKHFEDLSAQLQLFLDENEDLGIRPEAFIKKEREAGRSLRQIQAMLGGAPLTSLRAFKESHSTADWRSLMRLFLVRRTRSYVLKNYAHRDDKGYFLEIKAKRLYFPKRIPKSIPYAPDAITQRLFAEEVVDIISSLHLPRYGLADYIRPASLPNCLPTKDEGKVYSEGRYSENGKDCLPTKDEKKVLCNLKQARTQLRGFIKASLYKRLESSTYSFLLSLLRHIVRNFFLLEAIHRGEIIVGSADVVTLLDSGVSDQAKGREAEGEEESTLPQEDVEDLLKRLSSLSLNDLQRKAQQLLEAYYKEKGPAVRGHRVRACLFSVEELEKHLREDIERFWEIVQHAQSWTPDIDTKREALEKLLSTELRGEKVIIFTQFADTAYYLYEQLRGGGALPKDEIEIITSDTRNIREIVRRFSPKNNNGLPENTKELNILISTDVLSEGQNLQDASIVINYDLPWAIIRLIQRAGRVDRIGQESAQVYVYSFLLHDGLEAIIRLRQRLLQRLRENQEILGSDEEFFREEKIKGKLEALYAERPEVLEEEEQEEDIDLAAEALAVWRKASPKDREKALALPPMSRTATSHPELDGMVAYFRFQNGHDSLLYVSAQTGEVLQSSVEVFRKLKSLSRESAICSFASEENDTLLEKCLEAAIAKTEERIGGALGNLHSSSRRLHEVLRTAEDPIAAKVGEQLRDGKPLQDKARRALQPLLQKSNPSQKQVLDILTKLYLSNQLFHEVEEPTSPYLLCALRLYPSC